MFDTEPVIPAEYFPEKLQKSVTRVRAHETDMWPLDGLFGAASYDADFMDVLMDHFECQSFVELVTKLKSQFGHVHVLDVMGGGFFIPPSSYDQIDSMTALRLANTDDDELKKYEEQKAAGGSESRIAELNEAIAMLSVFQSSPKRKGVFGSAYDRVTWGRLSEDMEVRGIPSYDLVVCRPAGPFSPSHLLNEKEDGYDQNLTQREILKYAVLFTQLFDELMQRVNPESGLMFLEIPGLFQDKYAWLQRWVKNMQKKYGVSITIGGYYEYVFVRPV